MTNEPQATSSCCSTKAPVPAVVAQPQDFSDGSNPDMTTCLVMPGTPVSKSAAEAVGLFRDFEGNRYWFCCPGCGPAFAADPAKYAASLA